MNYSKTAKRMVQLREKKKQKKKQKKTHTHTQNTKINKSF